MQKLRVTNIKTGKVFERENRNHAWNDLAIEMCKADQYCGLVYSDTECLLKHPDSDTWYLLDECGNWVYIPSNYSVEVI